MRKIGPWTQNESRQAYKNPWIEVVEDKVTRPDGKPGIYGVIKGPPGVAILALDEEGYVYLVKEFRYAKEKYSIETPGGAGELGETSLGNAKRELKEEVGITAKKWTALGTADPFTSIADIPTYLFLAQDLTISEPEHEGTEVMSTLRVKFEEAVKMVMDNKITLAESIAVILKAKEYLKK